MRIAVVAGLAALALVAGLADDVSARSHAKKNHKYAKAQARQASSARALKPDGYIEREVSKLPFGSALWWDQMMRENRAGQCCN
jgi:hypothetical protein